MQSAVSYEPASRGRVLIVDDEPAVLKIFARMLRTSGFQVDASSRADEGLALFERERHHVVVSDIAMPGMSGIDLVRAIRAIDLDTPILLVTGAPDTDSAVESVNSGATRYLMKPIAERDLVDAVDQAANLYRMALLKREAVEQLGGEGRIGDRIGLGVKFGSALEQLYIAYQPLVRWSTKEVAAYEALVRSRESAMPHPGALFDAAERLDRLFDLSRRIRVLAPLSLLDLEQRGPLLFYNLHVRDLGDEMLYDPEADIAKIAHRVVLEITERTALDEVRDPRGCIVRLREMGFRIAVDDLGAGYAGLTSFAQLEPDVVKLDMTLVRDVDRTPTKQKLVRSMALLCRDMGIEVVAEGVETADERDCVVALGCDLLQGYLFAKPAEPFPEVRW